MTPNESATTEPAAAPPHRVLIGPLLFCIALMIVGVGYLGVVVWRYTHPANRDAPQRNIADDAISYIQQTKPAPLSGKLAEILEDAENVHFNSYQHPLVGKPAPEFARKDVDGNEWSLKQELKKGPVVVIVYLGYHCNHCVSQLFDVKQDYSYFRELGADVVAISPDTTSNTLEKYKQYERFPFPVLSDRSNSIAEAYSVNTPAKDGKPDDLLHGTFVIDQSGIVRWAAFGPTPFGDNKTLLYELAKITGRIKKN